MTDRESRERLIELIEEAKEEYAGDVTDHTETEYIVECLLNNGVIVPPCKVEDVVYYLTTVDAKKELNAAEIFCGTVEAISLEGKLVWVAVKYTNGLYYHHTSKDFGKTVFLTKEEAEKALAERKENGSIS